MGKTQKTLEEMDVMDDFLVNAAALDQELGEEFCRLILETLLQRQIGKIHITAQKTLQGILPEKRGDPDGCGDSGRGRSGIRREYL